MGSSTRTDRVASGARPDGKSSGASPQRHRCAKVEIDLNHLNAGGHATQSTRQLPIVGDGYRQERVSNPRNRPTDRGIELRKLKRSRERFLLLDNARWQRWKRAAARITGRGC